jgi:AAA domain
MDLKDYTPPQFVYDLLAEQALLKIALHGDAYALQLCGELGELMWSHKHRQLAIVMSTMHLDHRLVDPVSVLAALAAQGLVSKIDGPFLHGVYAGPGEHVGVRQYGDRIRKLAARRSLREVMVRGTQILDYAWGTADDDLEQEQITQLREDLDQVEILARPGGSGLVPEAMSEFLLGPTDFNWIVPGLLEKRERMIITGSEGTGKSVLTSQLASCMAGGIHPFTGRVLGDGNKGIRVTVIDCENNPVQSRRRFLWVNGKVDKIRRSLSLPPVDWKSQMSIAIHTEGFDLLKPADVAQVAGAIEASKPDLLVLGPLYKLFEADPSDETACRKLIGVLDRLRARYGFALLTEAHPGKSEDGGGNRRMAPIGSSLWLRWPEYGFGLRRSRKATNPERAEIVDVVSWRGTRESRQWPAVLEHGERLPWMTPPERPSELLDQEPDGWSE